MELSKDDAAVCLKSIDAPDTEISASEIDLYQELIAFVELPPEEQVRVVDQTSQPEPASADSVEGHAFSEQAHNQILVESTGTKASPAELELAGVLNEALEPVPAPETQTTYEAEEHTSLELALAYSPIEAKESGKELIGEDSVQDSEVPVEFVDRRVAPTPFVSGPRHSGPLSGFNLPPELVYTGALSHGVCLACGADSGADDLFCLTCGVFIDEIGSTLPADPTCGECNQRIEADEIFCPWCGSTMPE